MPLRKGKSLEAVRKNIEKLIKEGYDPDQAVAIAYSYAKRSSRAKKKK